jgi:hypothetical protein
VHFHFVLCCVAWFLFGLFDLKKTWRSVFVIGMHDFYYGIRQLFWIFWQLCWYTSFSLLHALSIRVSIALYFCRDVSIANVCGLGSQLSPHDMGQTCLPDPRNVLGLAPAMFKVRELGFKVY